MVYATRPPIRRTPISAATDKTAIPAAVSIQGLESDSGSEYFSTLVIANWVQLIPANTRKG